MPRPAALLQMVVLFSFLACMGCTTPGPAGYWGERATLSPGWNRVARAASHAATAPRTWVPLAGAALLYSTGQDEKISAWAAERQPVFGDGANDASSKLSHASSYIYTATALLAPSGEIPEEWLWNKSKGAIVGAASFGLVNAVTDYTKEEVGRMRPDESGTRSFISGHASYTASRMAMSSRILEHMEMAPPYRQYLDYGFYGVTIGCAWSRVEAEAHYPSDVLAAMSVANFLVNFMNDLFLNPIGEDNDLSTQISGNATMLTFQHRF